MLMGKKVEEHYAIIMTKVVPTKDQLATLPKIQHQVYDLVLRTTLAMFADPYEYEAVSYTHLTLPTTPYV